MSNQKRNIIKAESWRSSRSRFGLSPTPNCTGQTFEVTSSTSPPALRSTPATKPTISITPATVPSFGHQTYTFSNASENKSTNIFGSSTTSSESRFGPPSVFSFGGGKNTFPGNMQPNNSSGQTTPSGFKLTPIASNAFSVTAPEVKFKPVTSVEPTIRNSFAETTNVAFQCITVMDQYKNKSLEELRYEYYTLHLRRPKLCGANSKQKSSVGDEKAHNPFDFTNFAIIGNCEPPKVFPKELPKFNFKHNELQKSPKATTPENDSVLSEALDKLTDVVNSLSFRLDQLELFSYQNSSPRRENSDLLPWSLYKPKLKLNEKNVPEDLEVQRLAGVLNCVILTVPEEDRKEIEFLMLLVSVWPCLPGYVKTFTYNKMETLWQNLSNSIRLDDNPKFCSPLANERRSFIGCSPKGLSAKTESP